jgi:hypothetical protein
MLSFRVVNDLKWDIEITYRRFDGGMSFVGGVPSGAGLGS